MKRKRRMLALCMALLAAAGAVFAAPRAQAAPSKLVAITYDDGPSGYTPQLLDGLKQRGVKATFFMVGQSVPRYAATVERVYREGHQVANHSYNHSDFTTLSYNGVRNQVQGTNDLLDRACGRGTEYMVRPPYGSLNSNACSAAWAPLILWSVDPQDWLYRNAETVRRNIVGAAHDGAIILVHDIHATSIPGSLAAIDQLQAQGYEFVTVRELMRRRGVTPQEGARYTKISARIDDPGPVAVPEVSAALQGDKLLVTMKAQPGAKIYYSLTGASLNQESAVYTGPFTIEGPVRIWAAAAFNMNGSRSETVEASFGRVLSTALYWAREGASRAAALGRR